MNEENKLTQMYLCLRMTGLVSKTGMNFPFSFSECLNSLQKTMLSNRTNK